MDSFDEFPADRAHRIADAVEEIERNVSRLRELRSLTREEYKADDAQDRRDAVERKFEKITEAALDIAREILKQERGTAPDRRKETVTALEREGIIDDALARRMESAVGFRDVLAHTYGPIVNDDIVYNALQNELDRYVEFVEAVDEYLQATGDGS